MELVLFWGPATHVLNFSTVSACLCQAISDISRRQWNGPSHHVWSNFTPRPRRRCQRRFCSPSSNPATASWLFPRPSGTSGRKFTQPTWKAAGRFKHDGTATAGPQASTSRRRRPHRRQLRGPQTVKPRAGRLSSPGIPPDSALSSKPRRLAGGRRRGPYALPARCGTSDRQRETLMAQDRNAREIHYERPRRSKARALVRAREWRSASDWVSFLSRLDERFRRRKGMSPARPAESDIAPHPRADFPLPTLGRRPCGNPRRGHRRPGGFALLRGLPVEAMFGSREAGNPLGHRHAFRQCPIP